MNCCQHYMLHTNLHILYIHFFKIILIQKVFQESNNYFKSYQVKKIEYFVELYFNLHLHWICISDWFLHASTIQCFTLLVPYEHKRVLFHIMPCHDGSY